MNFKNLQKKTGLAPVYEFQKSTKKDGNGFSIWKYKNLQKSLLKLVTTEKNLPKSLLKLWSMESTKKSAKGPKYRKSTKMSAKACNYWKI